MKQAGGMRLKRRPSVTKSRRVARYAWRFITDARYRNKVLLLVNRFVDAEVITAENAPEEFAESRPWLADKRLFFIGGCEFTFVREFFDLAGADTFHTFDHGRASDPLVEVGDPGSPLWEFEPDAIILSQSQLTIGLFHNVQWHGRTMSREQQDNDLRSVIGSLEAAVDLIRTRFDCPVFVLGHPLVHRPSLGVYDQTLLGQTRSLAELLLAYRQELYELARRYPATFVLDPQTLLEGIGTLVGLNSMGSIGEILGEHFTRDGGREIAIGLLKYLHASDSRSPKVKCVVVDLDNTLWSGVLREDGPSGVYVRTHTVWALRYLMDRGLLVAVCSKNDEAEAEHLEGLLGKEFVENLVAVHLSWGAKSQALTEIAEFLNLGLDSLVFVDDNERERAEVSQVHPDVRVFADSEIFSLLSLPEFQAGPTLTEEATSRADSYRAEASRSQHAAKESNATPEKFLHSLSLKAVIRPSVATDLPRVAELLQRTNQLNATGQRSNLADIQSLNSRSDAGIFVVYASDRFGDYGLIGAATFIDGSGERKLTELAFSCRAMGRGIEAAALGYLIRAAASEGLNGIEIAVVPTTRNAEIIRIVAEAGFRRGHDDAFHRSSSEAPLPYPSWIEVDNCGGLSATIDRAHA